MRLMIRSQRLLCVLMPSLCARPLVHDLGTTWIGLLSRHEFQQLRGRLKTDFSVIEPEAMSERLRDATEAASLPIFVDARLRGLGSAAHGERRSSQ